MNPALHRHYKHLLPVVKLLGECQLDYPEIITALVCREITRSLTWDWRNQNLQWAYLCQRTAPLLIALLSQTGIRCSPSQAEKRMNEWRKANRGMGILPPIHIPSDKLLPPNVEFEISPALEALIMLAHLVIVQHRNSKKINTSKLC